MSYGNMDPNNERYRLADEKTIRLLREGLARMRRRDEIDLQDKDKREVIILPDGKKSSRY